MFTIILQNSVTKEIYSYNLTDNTPDSIYYEFEIELKDMTDGEYEYVLIENPGRLPVSSNYNNIFKSEMEDPVIIVNLDGKPLTNGAKILISEMGEVRQIEALTFGLCRVGDYKASKTEYNKQNKYVTYERK